MRRRSLSLAETSRGYFFVDFSSHVSGIDKSAAALSTNEDLKICGYTSSLGVGGAPIRGNIRVGDFDAFGSTEERRVLGAKFRRRSEVTRDVDIPAGGIFRHRRDY